VPSPTVLEMPSEEPVQMRAILRRARSGSRLALPVVRRCADGRTPTAMATCLLCSRSSGYRIGRASRARRLGLQLAPDGPRSSALRLTVFMPWLRRSRRTCLTAAPRAYGWCRPRWSGAILAATRPAQHGLEVAAALVRRWLHAMGGGWQRAKRGATDDDPQRTERWARMRLHHAHVHAHASMVCADAGALHLLPTVGAAWMLPGTQDESMTPGPHAKHDRAGARHRATGPGLSCRGPRNNTAWLRALLTTLEQTYAAPARTRLAVVVANYRLQQATAVAQGLARHPCWALRWVPTSGPRAHPIARGVGDGHDTGTRNHTRQRRPEVRKDGERHVQANGPWQSQLSQLYAAPEVTEAVAALAAAHHPKIAACVDESRVARFSFLSRLSRISNLVDHFLLSKVPVYNTASGELTEHTHTM